MTEPELAIAPCPASELAGEIPRLGALLRACVLAGASISFVLPFTVAASELFWRDKVLPAVQAERMLLLVARQGGAIVGAVQLDYDTPPNQPHRAEVCKLMVQPELRRRGIARALMAELERRAPALGRTLLTLDTRTGDLAEPLYRSIGYQTVGVIPEFCRDTIIAERLDSTTIMYKRL
jgi:hypothetical protein